MNTLMLVLAVLCFVIAVGAACRRDAPTAGTDRSCRRSAVAFIPTADDHGQEAEQQRAGHASGGVRSVFVRRVSLRNE